MTITERKIPAEQVEAGMFLPGLGNGYVIEAEHDQECSAFSGRYNVSLGSFTVLTFHTSQGDEAYVLIPGDEQITVGEES